MPNTIKTKGFSLVEAAIVLGVVGLVIGGIWVAASAISSTLKVNRAVTGILQTADNLRHIVPRSVATGSWVNISTLALHSGAVPRDLLINGAIKSPWGYQ